MPKISSHRQNCTSTREKLFSSSTTTLGQYSIRTTFSPRNPPGVLYTTPPRASPNCLPTLPPSKPNPNQSHQPQLLPPDALRPSKYPTPWLSTHHTHRRTCCSPASATASSSLHANKAPQKATHSSPTTLNSEYTQREQTQRARKKEKESQREPDRERETHTHRNTGRGEGDPKRRRRKKKKKT